MKPASIAVRIFNNNNNNNIIIIQHNWQVSESRACPHCGKTGSLEYILAGCKKMLHQYTRWHNQVLEVLASAVKHQCQSKVPEPLRQGILFVRKSERAMQKYAWKVMPMVSSHDNWKMLADLHSPLVFHLRPL